jgi:hypothetical protein
VLAPSILSDPAYLLIALGALFVHVCYQLSVSVLTHFSSHSLSRKTSDHRLLGLGFSYSLGVIITTVLIITSLASLAQLVHGGYRLLGVLVVGLAPFIGLATVLWYYRQGEGTRLWLPRSVAKYLLERSKETKSLLEAALLGAGTVIGELPFLVGPLLFVTYLISFMPPLSWLAWATLYSVLAALPLLVTTMYLTSGHSIARVQKWRESNKSFLQWTSGIALVLLTIFLTVVQLGVSQ